jgi:hypothetical protein
MSYIKIHREILDSYCFSSANAFKIWMWLLLKANYKKSYITLKAGRGETTLEINRGQLIFGRFKAEDELGIDGSLIYRVIKKFEELEQIIIESNNQYSIITICKYDSYQGEDNNSEQQMSSKRTANEQQMNSKRTANEQQTNTYKEELEEKEYKEEIKNNSTKKISNGTWEDEKKLFQNAEQYFYNLCMKFSIEKSKMEEFASEFLSQIELKEDFKSEKELKKHFANWINIKNLKKEEPKLKNNYIVQTPKHLW